MGERPPLVFVHVHYPEIWAEMAVRLASAFDQPFGLVLTCRDAAFDLAVPQTPHLAFVRRITVENRGRDVLPFLVALREMGETFEIGLKLHTKRSVHRDDGEAWRRFLVDSLLSGKAEEGPAALALMEAEPRIGLVAPEAHLLPLRSRLVMNRRITRRLAETLATPVTLEALERERFAAGSMFWFRRDALARFADPSLDSLFAPEEGQLDGTAAHAAERLFAHVCAAQGYVATAMEAVDPLLRAARSPGETDLDAVSERAMAAARNPFILPLAKLWLRFPSLLVGAHYAYRSTPRPIWRVARTLVRRLVASSRAP